MAQQALTLRQLNERISSLVTKAAELRNVWVVAEISDLRARPGSHCYMEMIAKDAQGRVTDKLRATVWAQTWARIDAEFRAATGKGMADGMQVMFLVTVAYHGAYGLAANVTAVNPAYTMGDLMMRRNQILQRLQQEGVLTLNRELVWTEAPLRIAVISAKDAAGYGDFINQLYRSASRLRFTTRLFPATLQGDRAVPTLLSALEAVAEQEEQWDCVVLIRGGGATTDFAAFENYDLASHIAQFPLPVIVGIGHERDVTVLDYVANMRVKTPTAAAEWLINRGEEALGKIDALARQIHAQASMLVAQCNERLAYAEGALPHLPKSALESAGARLNQLMASLTRAAQTRTTPEKEKLTRCASVLENLPLGKIKSEADRLSSILSFLRPLPGTAVARARQLTDSRAELLGVLSPEATLRRGYSITRLAGHAVTRAEEVAQGATLVTTLAFGEVTSVVKG